MINKKALIKNFKVVNNKYYMLSLLYRGDFVYKPGQYIIIIFNDKLRRSYSIASVKNNEILISVKLDKGLGAKALMDFKLNKEVEFIGPIGHFFYRKSSNDPIFIATGIGITPINSIIEHLISSNISKLKLFWGVKNSNDLIFNFDYLNDNFIPILSEEDGSNVKKGYVTDYLSENIDDFKNKDFYICGNPDIVNNIKTYLQKNFKVEKDYIYTEKF